jgi:hypothetical protein
MVIPDTLTPDQEEILITLRALAGLVAQALRQKAALPAAAADEAGATVQCAQAELLFWRDFALYHTRRLLPALAGVDAAGAYRQVVEELVRAVYLEDATAIARHGCDPATCTHPAHWRE